MNIGAVRSLLRSLLFILAPAVLGYFTDALWLRQLIPALTPEVASLVAGLVGMVARALLPDVLGKRSEAQ